MAYFDCIVGGSGKGNTLVVTCADDLAGATITCTNGTKTYTKTCPSTAPYEVTFYGLAAGTWTVSATVSGNTYTTTVVITDYEAELGGFSWRRWVDTASQLDSTDYASLSEVLADEEAVRELCLEHACVDYLAAVPSVNTNIETIINNDLFAKWANNSDYSLDVLGANVAIKALMDEADKYGYGEWIITDNTTTPPTWGPKGNVPVMTSNTAPYGEASASVVPYSSHPAWHAFDGNSSTAYSAGNTANAILSYKFTNPVCVKRVLFDTDKSANFSASIKTWDIIAKNDASANWETIYSGSNDDVKIVEQEISCNQYYLYWGIKIKTSYRSDSYALDTLQFYGRELSDLVPTMFTNTTPKGEAFADSAYSSSYTAYKAFDKNITDAGQAWHSAPQSTPTGHWVGYEFEEPTIITKAVLVRDGRWSTAYTLRGNLFLQAYDGNNWVNLVSDITLNGGSLGSFISVDIPTPSAYSKYRFYTPEGYLSTDGKYYLSVEEVFLFGPDYSEKEFEEGSTKKWLYDHGVELESITLQSSSTVVKESSQIVSNGDTVSDGAASIANFASVDLSSYSIIRGVLGNKHKKGAIYGCIFVAKGDTMTWDTSTWLAWMQYTTYSNPYTDIGVDISSINESKKIAIATGSEAARQFSIKELWLE